MLGISQTNSLINPSNEKLYATKSGSYGFNKKTSKINSSNSTSCTGSGTCNSINSNNLKKKNVSICSTFRPGIGSNLQNTVSFGVGNNNLKKGDNIGVCNIRIHKDENLINHLNILTSNNTELL